MQSRDKSFFLRSAKVILFLVMLSGCATSQSSVTLAPTSTNTRLTELSALASTIKVYQGEILMSEVNEGETVNIQVGDRIEVAPDGLGMLRLPFLVDIELFQDAIVRLAEVREESGGSTFVLMEQERGHTNVSLVEGAQVQVRLVTEDATITTLEDGTEFIVCKAPGELTCLDVQKGAVQNTAQGVSKYLEAGTANYVLKGQPPSPVVCAPVEIFIAWKEQARISTPSQAVGNLVSELPQRTCEDPGADTTSLPGSVGMEKIDAGIYEVGRDPENETYSARQPVQVNDFWIDAYEVTVANFQQYLDQTGEQPPANWPDEPNIPVRGVTWDQANAFCTWAKKRLPNEAEWEIAGRGSGENAPLYPWGNDPDAGGKVESLPLSEPYAVGTFAFNVSPSGVYDLVGNVWEWVGQPYTEVPAGQRVLRGGRFGLLRDLAYRYLTTANDERIIPNAGFRCAADQVE
jgi:iron(II)-dependent oxidoreductase